MTNDAQYLRNEEGKIEIMPLIGWHTESFGYGLLLQVRFAETPKTSPKGCWASCSSESQLNKLCWLRRN